MTPDCSHPSCTTPPLVQWQRRPTSTELDGIVTIEQDRRAQALLLADPQQPAPEFGPLPTAQDTLIPVYGCGQHAIRIGLAALVHASDCTAPNLADLPSCNCTPEPAPPPQPMHTEAQPLPDHWK